jgi:hypothetical protein
MAGSISYDGSIDMEVDDVLVFDKWRVDMIRNSRHGLQLCALTNIPLHFDTMVDCIQDALPMTSFTMRREFDLTRAMVEPIEHDETNVIGSNVLTLWLETFRNDINFIIESPERDVLFCYRNARWPCYTAPLEMYFVLQGTSLVPLDAEYHVSSMKAATPAMKQKGRKTICECGNSYQSGDHNTARHVISIEHVARMADPARWRPNPWTPVPPPVLDEYLRQEPEMCEKTRRALKKLS